MPIALHFLSVLFKNSGFFTAKSHTQNHHDFTRVKSIQNNAVFADHTESSPSSHSHLARFAFFPNLIVLIIPKTIKKCKGGTKKSSTFFFVIFSQQNDNFVSALLYKLRKPCPKNMYTADPFVSVACQRSIVGIVGMRCQQRNST